MNRILLLLFCMLSGFHLSAQGPYQLKGKLEIPLLGSAVVTTGVALALHERMIPLTIMELEGLNGEDINRLDRSALLHYSSAANMRSHYGERIPLALGAISTFVFPVITHSDQTDGREWLTLLVIWGEANLVSASGTHLSKSWVKRARPYVYNPDVVQEAKLTVVARKSFMSGHTSASAVNTFFMAKVFSDYFPDSRFKPVMWSVAAAIPAWTGIERYLAGKHFPTDIITAYAFGAICGYFIPHFHKMEGWKGAVNLTILPASVCETPGLNMVLKF